ncbi:xaa-Pro aminopeptidase 1-like [Amphiura filiformis]|uniref:xaa-Pro aminopeptidase 1-like n=1 Tax=Amphiura filiformis TaxID=82378 RepID=UPI003B21FAFE
MMYLGINIWVISVVLLWFGQTMGNSVRNKRQADVRNCDATPPYLPDTVTETGDRLQALRRLMADRRYNVQAYLIPEVDAHHSEYLAEHDRRRTYISGFTGSAGLSVVTPNVALLYTDGRYFLQAEQQLDCNWELVKFTGDPNFAVGAREWLAENLNNGARVGFDPTLMSVGDYEGYKKTFDDLVGKRITLVPIADGNLIDLIWDMQPSYPNTTMLILDANKYTGETWQQKIWEFEGEESLRGKMAAEGADAIVLSKLDEIAWLYNMRGQDIPYNPMFVSYTIITTDSIRLYLFDREGRLTDEVRTHLNIGNSSCSTDETLAAECVAVLPYERFLTDLGSLRANKIWISDESSYAIYDRVPPTKAIIKSSPVLLMKAVKSLKEREGMRSAQIKDSVVLCELGAWLEEMVNSLEDPMVGDISILNETTVEEKATELRKQQDLYQDLSFQAISAFGPNGAVIHYRSSNATNRAINKDGVFLFDSGTQYLDGTTDITRSYHFGKPTKLMKEAYTRVLMGRIDVAQSIWRTGVYGRDLDAIARNPLWQAGLGYLHGTGHGIGHFLAVHEGPARLRIGYADWHEPYEIGMFTSDEPGYYADGEFGVRIEDIVEVVEAETMYKFNNWTYMTFEMITAVPLEPNLIDFSLMSPKQLDHYNAYNKRVRDLMGPRVSEKARKWMESKTKPRKYKFTLNDSTHLTTGISALLLSLVASGFLK